LPGLWKVKKIFALDSFIGGQKGMGITHIFIHYMVETKQNKTKLLLFLLAKLPL